MAAIEVDRLVVRYGEACALDNATVRVGEGRVTDLIGMNGSGKSTLFKAIMGFVRPDSGEVRVEGATPGAARRRGLVTYVPQDEAVDWDCPVSVRDSVMMGRHGHQVPATGGPHRSGRCARPRGSHRERRFVATSWRRPTGMAMTLDELHGGHRAIVTNLDSSGGERHRLMDLGLVPGVEVRAERTSPLGDPTAYLVRGSVIVLRRSQARGIQIEMSAGDAR